MNLKTTLALLILLASGAGLVWTGFDPTLAPRSTPIADTREETVLDELKPEAFQRIEILRGNARTVLTKAGDGAWLMPGNWPTRAAEVQQLLAQLGQLRSRFAPLPITDDDLARFGLAPPAVTVVVKTTVGEHRLAFGEGPAREDATRFDRPTYLRIAALPAVLHLPPGLVALLDRPADYYQQRRLFPSQRVPREEGSSVRVDRLTGTRLEAWEGGKRKFTLVQGPDGWELSQPSRDALDPRTRDALLDAVPDIWAERFVPADQAKSLDELGLKEPDRVLTVTRPDGATVTLEVGKPVLEGAPSNRSYARLRGFDRIFEVNADKLNPIYVSLDTLRDSQLARFKSEDAREVEITTPRGKVLLRNAAPQRLSGDAAAAPKSDWKLVEPVAAPADAALVDQLLSTLAGLSATDKDVTEKARTAAAASATTLPALAGAQASLVASWLLTPKWLAETYGLAPPTGTVKVTVAERKGEGKPLVMRMVSIRLGRHDRARKKLYAQSQDWPRINEIDDALAGLVLDKTSMDYRGRRLLDFASSDVEQIAVRRLDLPALGTGLISLVAGLPGYGRLGAAAALAADRTMGVTLKRTPDGWALTSPVQVPADVNKAFDLADRLGKLEVLTFVADQAPANQLETRYGLGVPELAATVAFTNPNKPARTLQIGKMRPGAPGYFARLEGAPEVFAVASDLVGQLDRNSLAYRPAALWQVGGDEIVRLRIHKAGQAEYELLRKGEEWQVNGPFTVAAPRDVVDRLTAALQSPKAEEYRAHTATDLAPFGLDRPAVTLTLTTKQGKQHSLSIGRETTRGAVGKFARLSDATAVFVIADVLAKTVDQSALDFLDRNILTFDSGAATSFVRKWGPDVLELVKQEDAWRLVKPSEQPADEKKVPELLKELGELKAVRIVAYRPTDRMEYGLQPPEATIAIKLGDAKSAEYVLELGKEVAGGAGERFAQLRGGPSVGVLAASVVKKLLAGPLSYRDHALARVPDADTIKLESGERKATFAKPEGSWKLTQPLSADADHDALEGFLNSLARLRADELVVEKPTEEQLKSFGLERPAVRWRFLSGDKVELDLSVGAAEKGSARRYARMAGKDLVFLLDAKLSGQLLAEYRPRTVFKDNVDPAQIESVRFGYANNPFTLKKVDGMWQVAGKPDVKVNATAVSNALSGLRDLKLERYVKDTGAQLKLYGLDPPELVLEATTPTGVVVLHLGGLEGASRRRYARVPVPGRADVFELDESASTKLTPDLATLTKGAR